jgi:hypothetical protein
VLCLAGVVALDQDDTTERLAVDFSDVVLDPAVVAIGADELELLAVIQRLDGEHH